MAPGAREVKEDPLNFAGLGGKEGRDVEDSNAEGSSGSFVPDGLGGNTLDEDNEGSFDKEGEGGSDRKDGEGATINISVEAREERGLEDADLWLGEGGSARKDGEGEGGRVPNPVTDTLTDGRVLWFGEGGSERIIIGDADTFFARQPQEESERLLFRRFLLP